MDKEAAIAVLTAMITPAVLISACGSMILSTSSRLGRVVDRVRALSDRLETMAAREESGKLLELHQIVVTIVIREETITTIVASLHDMCRNPGKQRTKSTRHSRLTPNARLAPT